MYGIFIHTGDCKMQEFWKIAPTDIVDYLFLMELFKEYKQPRLKKMHVLLYRQWVNRIVKGRDWYDFVWYISRGLKVTT